MKLSQYQVLLYHGRMIIFSSQQCCNPDTSHTCSKELVFPPIITRSINMQGNSVNSSIATVLIGSWVGLCPARRDVFTRGCHNSFSQAAKKKKLSIRLHQTHIRTTNAKKRINELKNLPDTICDYKNWFSGSSQAHRTKNGVIHKIKNFLFGTTTLLLLGGRAT
jgi:hypothetical protein